MARTLLDRAKNIPSNDEDKKSEVQHVVDALKTNGSSTRRQLEILMDQLKPALGGMKSIILIQTADSFLIMKNARDGKDLCQVGTFGYFTK